MADVPATGRLAVPQILGSGALLFGIVENNTDGMPLAGTHSADAVTKVDPIVALGAFHWAIMHRKCNGVALPQRDDFGAALHARPLFGDDELPARKIPIRFRKQDRHLQRKREVAVQILMQTIEVARHVLQEKRCRPGLTRRVALPQKFHVTLRVTTLDVHLFVPGIGHYRQTRIERSSQASEEIWQRILEVAVFAFTESMPSHVDVTTEEVFFGVERSDFPALIAGKSICR
jgi:hypothetical protein